VFDSHFQLHTFFTGQFTDPNAPSGFAPFGIKDIGGVLFVTFAKQDAARHDDVAGPGNGFIDEFDTSGHFIMRFASGTAAGGALTALNSPFGMAVAPTGFGSFGGDLLVGNFGDSHVSAYDMTTGQLVGQLTDTHGNPMVLNGGFQETSDKGLWGINFGNGAPGTSATTLFFAAGINDESDGLFGKVIFDPSATSSAMAGPSASSAATGQHAFMDAVFRLSSGPLTPPSITATRMAPATPEAQIPASPAPITNHSLNVAASMGDAMTAAVTQTTTDPFSILGGDTMMATPLGAMIIDLR
jgi:hypothetical protein